MIHMGGRSGRMGGRMIKQLVEVRSGRVMNRRTKYLFCSVRWERDDSAIFP